MFLRMAIQIVLEQNNLFYSSQLSVVLHIETSNSFW